MTEQTPHDDDMRELTELHEEFLRKITLMIPMNMHDENQLGDIAIWFQDASYEVGRKRGQCHETNA